VVDEEEDADEAEVLNDDDGVKDSGLEKYYISNFTIVLSETFFLQLNETTALQEKVSVPPNNFLFKLHNSN
jgi:hypothetical protein